MKNPATPQQKIRTEAKFREVIAWLQQHEPQAFDQLQKILHSGLYSYNLRPGSSELEHHYRRFSIYLYPSDSFPPEEDAPQGMTSNYRHSQHRIMLPITPNASVERLAQIFKHQLLYAQGKIESIFQYHPAFVKEELEREGSPLNAYADWLTSGALKDNRARLLLQFNMEIYDENVFMEHYDVIVKMYDRLDTYLSYIATHRELSPCTAEAPCLSQEDIEQLPTFVTSVPLEDTLNAAYTESGRLLFPTGRKGFQLELKTQKLTDLLEISAEDPIENFYLMLQYIKLSLSSAILQLEATVTQYKYQPTARNKIAMLQSTDVLINGNTSFKEFTPLYEKMFPELKAVEEKNRPLQLQLEQRYNEWLTTHPEITREISQQERSASAALKA